MNTGNHRGWDGNTLKWIALLSMLIDHIGVIYLSYGSHALLSVYSLSRYIGRLSFPLFCFLLVEGFYHTGNLCKYVQRMLGFAFLAEIPYDLAIYGKIVKLDPRQKLSYVQRELLLSSTQRPYIMRHAVPSLVKVSVLLSYSLRAQTKISLL